MNGPQATWLPDGRRLHLNHGPIDLIVEAFGDPDEKRLAYAQAATRFESVLAELVEELADLRRPAHALPRRFKGPTANRMEQVVCRHAPAFVTPMAAVAGSVADETLAALICGRRLEKAYVNNGGDIALHLSDGQSMIVAIAGTGHGLADRILVNASDRVGGIATSGWRGRSHSLGIANSVTVLARTGADADAAATLVANAVDLPQHPAVTRVPACDLDPDSDLGSRPVTSAVGPLLPGEVSNALERGLAVAEAMRRAGLIVAAAVFLGGQSRLCGEIAHRSLAVHQGRAMPVPLSASPAGRIAHA